MQDDVAATTGDNHLFCPRQLTARFVLPKLIGMSAYQYCQSLSTNCEICARPPRNEAIVRVRTTFKDATQLPKASSFAPPSSRNPPPGKGCISHETTDAWKNRNVRQRDRRRNLAIRRRMGQGFLPARRYRHPRQGSRAGNKFNRHRRVLRRSPLRKIHRRRNRQWRPGRREDWIIATKFGHTFHGHLNRTDDRSAADIREKTTRRFPQSPSHRLHRPVPIPLDPRQRIRQPGTPPYSIKPSVTAKSATSATPSATAPPPVIRCTKPRRRPPHTSKRSSWSITASTARRGKGSSQLPAPKTSASSRESLASGFLTGKYKPRRHVPKDDVRSGKDQPAIDKRLREVEQIQNTEVPPNVPLRSGPSPGA